MANNSKKNLNLVRVISEYYMMKKVLGNEYSHDILTGAIPVNGQNGAADKMTLLEMKKYVDQIGEMKISANGLGKAETFDAFLERLMKKYLSLDVVKSLKQQNEISENPFDESFANLVNGALQMENAKSRIEVALQVNPQIVEKISSLPILLGGKKQSSYVKLLSQCTDLFSSVSGLEAQIETLKASGKAKDADIAKLTAELEEQRKKAAEYKDLLDKAISGMGKSTEETKIFINILTQTRGQLDVITKDVAVQGRATRLHVSREADRVISGVENLIYEKDKVKKQIFDHPTLYPVFISCYSGKQLNVKKELPEALNEIKRATTSAGLKSTSNVVDSLYNDLNEHNYSNGKQPVTTKKGGKFVKAASLFIALAIGAGGALGIAHATGNFPANNTAGGDTTINVIVDENYGPYMERENQQLNDYMSKLTIALQDGTLVSFDDLTNAPNFQGSNAKAGAWDADALEALRNQYASDDQVEKYGWSSTGEIDAETRAAISGVQAEFYETNYSLLLSQVSSLNDQIDKLTQSLDQANADKAILQAQIDALQAQIDNLQSIIDAAEDKYNADTSELQQKVDELQQKVDEANQKISELEQENADLVAENQQLKNQVNNLDNQIAELQDLIANLRYENTVLSTEKASLKSKVVSLENQIAELQEQIDSMSGSDASQLQSQVNELTKALEEANKTIDSLRSTNEALTQQVVELQGSISELNKDVTNLENSIKNLTSENSSLKTEVSNLQSSLSQSMMEYNNLLEQYNALLNAGGNQAEVDALRAELNSAYSLINAYESKIVSLYNGMTKSSSTSAEAMQNLENLMDMFGITYDQQTNSSQNSSSQYQPGV